MHPYTNAYNSVFHRSEIANKCKQPVCLSVVERINKLGCLHTMEYYTTMRVNHPVLNGWRSKQRVEREKAPTKSTYSMGLLTGSVGRPCSSWSWGDEFKSHVGGRDCFRKKVHILWLYLHKVQNKPKQIYSDESQKILRVAVVISGRCHEDVCGVWQLSVSWFGWWWNECILAKLSQLGTYTLCMFMCYPSIKMS